MGAEDVRLAALGCLQYVDVVRIAHEWCAVTGVEDDNVRSVLKELRILQQVRVSKTIEVLKMRIPKHSGNLGNHFIRQHEPVAVLKNIVQQPPGHGLASVMRADQDCCIENDLYSTGL